MTVTVQVNGAPSSVDLYVTPVGGPLPSSTAVVYTGSAVQSSVKTSDGGNWLSFALTGVGTFSFHKVYALRVDAQPGQFGDYTGSVALSGSTFAPDNQTINVNLHVTTQPILQAAPIWIKGSTTVDFRNIGMGNLAIKGAAVSPPSPGAGSSMWLAKPQVATSTSVALSTADIASLQGLRAPPRGSYAGVLKLDSNAANTSVSFPLRLNLDLPGPAVSTGGRIDPTAFRACLAVGSDHSFDKLKQALGLSDDQILRCQQEAYSEPYYKAQAILNDDQKAKLQVIVSRLNRSDVDGAFAIWLGLNGGVGWPFCYCGCPMSSAAPFLGFTKAQIDRLWELQQAARPESSRAAFEKEREQLLTWERESLKAGETENSPHSALRSTRQGLAQLVWDRGPHLPREVVIPLLNDTQKAIAEEMETALSLASEAKELNLVSTKRPDSGPFCQ